MHSLARALATVGVWGGCAYACRDFPPMMLMVGLFAMVATGMIWAGEEK